MDVAHAIGELLATVVEEIRPLSGGDINDAYKVRLADGRTVFAKTNRHCPPGMFEAEAKGLAWLADAAALKIPEVIAYSNEAGRACLILEFLESGRHRATFDEDLGRGLAALHRVGAPRFGLDHDNFIGSLPQQNSEADSWTQFFGEQRIGAQVERARRAGLIDKSLAKKFEALLTRLQELVGPPEPPARLHGDLWGGNLHATAEGEPALIDPACYAGHREVDLAMMRLFGGFGSRVFAAYDEAFPLAPGHEERVALYQLYPMLVHLNLFGAGYLGGVERCLQPYV